MPPLLSIVIANYNYGRFLETAIRSVVEQDGFEECELIVVDGGSTDESVEVIRKYEKNIAWWVSEKDKGQSNAFNKGFAVARGKFLTWLNADDAFVPGCLRKVLESFQKHPQCEWFTANSFSFTNGGDFCRLVWGPHIFPVWLQREDAPVVAFGPSSFFTKQIFDAVGGVDEALHYTMDTELWIRFIKYGVKQRRISTFVWAFRMHTLSKTAEFGDHVMAAECKKRQKEEDRYACKKNCYHETHFAHMLIYALRIFDGSYLRGKWLSLILRDKKVIGDVEEL